MLSRSGTTFIKTSLLNDVYSNVDIHYPARIDGQGQSQFDFAFQFIANNQDYLTDPTAFKFSMNLVEQEWVTVNGKRSIVRNYTEIEYEL